MSINSKTSITKEILIEKANFIYDNSYFFHSNINDRHLMLNLKNILLNPAPLIQCEGYMEIFEEIKKRKKRFEKENAYQYSLETLFRVVYLIREVLGSPDITIQQTETIRQYVKYISTHNNGQMYYGHQNFISINMDYVENLFNQIKQEKKQKVAQKRKF